MAKAKKNPPADTDVKGVDKSTQPNTETKSSTGDNTYVPSQGASTTDSANIIDDLYTGSAEATFFKSPMVGQTFLEPFNQDDLWQKYGDYRIYEEMGNDDQVSVCLQIKRDLILGSGFSFISQEDGQDDMVKDLQYLFNEEPESSMEELCEEILTAQEFGFSVSEKIFKQIADGQLALKTLKTRYPNSFKFYQDDKGNVEKYTQFTSKEGEKVLNPKSLIHYINKPRFQNPYGTSDLRAAYNAYVVKRQVVKYFAIFLENAAGPKPVARYDKNAPKKAIDDIFNAIKSLQAKSALAIPKEVELEFLEAKNTGEAFEKAVNIFNLFISRALVLPDLVGLSGSQTGGGSYSLGKEQMGLFFLHINRAKKSLERMINKQLVEPVVFWNYGFIKNYPKFKFDPIDQTEARELAKLWLEAVKGKLWKPTEEQINHFVKLAGMPEGEVEFYAEPEPQQFDEYGRPIPPQNKPPGGQNPPPNGSDKNDDKGGGEEGEDENEKLPPKTTDKSADKKEFAQPFGVPPGNYYKKVDFTAIKNKLNDYDASLMNELTPIQNKMFADLEEQLASKRIIQTGNPDKMDTLSLKYKGEMRKVIEKSFRLLYKDAQTQAAAELTKGNYTVKKFAGPYTSPEFEKILEAEVWDFVGDYEYKILKMTKVQLIAAMKDGLPLSSVTTVLNTDGEKLSQQSLERYARTKHTELLNRGRKDYFDSTDVVVAYQYSAIMDNATTEICAGLDGKIFEASSCPIPPMHFNCRSTIIPITKYEDYKPTTSIRGMSPDEFIDENKGSGFSTT